VTGRNVLLATEQLLDARDVCYIDLQRPATNNFVYSPSIAKSIETRSSSTFAGKFSLQAACTRVLFNPQ